MCTWAGKNIVDPGSLGPFLHTCLSGRPPGSSVAHGNQGANGWPRILCCHGNKLFSSGNGENGVEWMGKGLHLCEAPETTFPPPTTGEKTQLSLGQPIAFGITGWRCFPQCAWVAECSCAGKGKSRYCELVCVQLLASVFLSI